MLVCLFFTRVVMAATTVAPERCCHVAPLGFAEHFRRSTPPMIRKRVHNLQAVPRFKPPSRPEVRTHLRLVSVLYRPKHQRRSELAQAHLEKAVSSSRMWRYCISCPNFRIFHPYDAEANICTFSFPPFSGLIHSRYMLHLCLIKITERGLLFHWCKCFHFLICMQIQNHTLYCSLF